MALVDFIRSARSVLRRVKREITERFQPDIPTLDVAAPEKSDRPEHVIFSISGASVVRTMVIILSLLALAYILQEIVDILVVFFVAFLLAAGMEPTVDYLERKHIPRGIGVLLFYVVLLTVLGIIVSYIVPLLARQMSELAIGFGGYLKGLARGTVPLPFSSRFSPQIQQFLTSVDIHELAGQIESSLQLVSSQLFTLGGNIWEVIKVVSHGFVNTVLVLFLAYFMTVDKHIVESFLFSLFPIKHEAYVAHKIMLIKKKIGYWLRGVLIMIVSMAVLVFIGLTILGVKYAAVIAIIAGFMEVIPVMGPIVAWFVAVPIVLNQSVWLVVPVTIVCFFIQQIEGHLLVPIVMQRVVGLNPIVILFALLVGYRFLGVVGAVLSVPAATMVSIILTDFFDRSRRK